MVMPRSRSMSIEFEDLLLHLPVWDVAAQLDEPVGERRLAMVDVSDDRKVADQVDIRHGRVLSMLVAGLNTGRLRALRKSLAADARTKIIRNCTQSIACKMG